MAAPPLVFVGREEEKGQGSVVKRGTREVMHGMMGQKWRLLKLEAMQRLEGSRGYQVS